MSSGGVFLVIPVRFDLFRPQNEIELTVSITPSPVCRQTALSELAVQMTTAVF